MSLETDFARLYASIGETVATRGAALVRATHARLQELSPVDTHRFQSNWQLGVDQPDTTTTESTSPTPLALPRILPGHTYYLTNALHYALKLEHGWSKQAPNGVASVVAAELQHGAIRPVPGTEG